MVPLINTKPTTYIHVSTQGHDGASGTSGSPLRTIQAAVDRADPGTMIMVHAGTYTENVRFSDSGSASAPIQLVSADGIGAAKIKPLDTNYNTIVGHGVENIVVRGFDISFTGGSNGNGVFFTQTTRDFSDLSKNIVVMDNIIHGNGEDGIKMAGADNVWLINNKISGASDQGIDFVAVKGGRIEGNTVTDVSGNAGIQVKGGTTDVLIANNTVRQVDGNGINVGGGTEEPYMRPGARDYEAGNIVAYGNTIEDVGSRAFLVVGAKDSMILNNTMRDTGSTYSIHLEESGYTHSPGYDTRNITIHGNSTDDGNWLRVDAGQGNGLSQAAVTYSFPALDGTGGLPSNPAPVEPLEPAPVEPIPVEPTPAPAPPEPPMPAPLPVAPAPIPVGEAFTGSGRDDSLTGTWKGNALYGYSGNDTLYGNGGQDQLFGGSGNDKLYGGSGADLLSGGSGNDRLVDTSGAGNWFDGGTGTNRYVSSKSVADVFVMSGKSYIDGSGSLVLGRDKIALVVERGMTKAQLADLIEQSFVRDGAYTGISIGNDTLLQTGNAELKTAAGWADHAQELFTVYSSWEAMRDASGYDWWGV